MRIGRWLQFICFVIWTLLTFGVYGQNKKIDSLTTVLNTTNQDTAKVNVLIALSRELIRAQSFTQAKMYLDNAINLAERTNNKPGILRTLTALGYYYHEKARQFQIKSNYPEAVKLYFTAIKTKEQAGDKRSAGGSYMNLSYAYIQMSRFNDALKSYQTALKIFEEVGDSAWIAHATNGVGISYMNLARYDEALNYYRKAIKIYELIGEKDIMLNQYFNLGFMYEDIGNYDEALKYHEIALNLARETGGAGNIAPALHNYGSVFYLKAKKEKDNDKKIQLLDRALDYQFKSLKTFQDGGIEYGLSTNFLAIGKIYFEMKDFAKARQFANDAIIYARKDYHTYDIKETLLLLSSVDSATGNWDDALRHYRSFIHYRDSLNSDEQTKKLLQAQFQFDFDKKEDSLRYRQSLTDERLRQQTLLSLQQRQQLMLRDQDLALLNADKKVQQLQIDKDRGDLVIQKAEAEKKQEQLLILSKEKDLQALDLKRQRMTKNYMIAGLILFGILSFFVYLNYHNRQKLKLQMLRNKIASDLHDDVGSTLSSISIFSLMAQQQSKEVIPLLETIGESSRKMLDAMADIVWTIKPENDQFEKIILRMRNFAYELLGAKHIDFEFVAGEDVSSMKLPMEIRKNLYLIFKEATNNMVKYSDANRAMFTIKRDKNNLTMQIRDYGKGFDLLNTRAGNGLGNMKKRANEIGAEIHIDSSPGKGTMIELRVAV